MDEPSRTLPLAPVCAAEPSQNAPPVAGTTWKSPPAARRRRRAVVGLDAGCDEQRARVAVLQPLPVDVPAHVDRRLRGVELCPPVRRLDRRARRDRAVARQPSRPSARSAARSRRTRHSRGAPRRASCPPPARVEAVGDRVEVRVGARRRAARAVRGPRRRSSRRRPCPGTAGAPRRGGTASARGCAPRRRSSPDDARRCGGPVASEEHVELGTATVTLLMKFVQPLNCR